MQFVVLVELGLAHSEGYEELASITVPRVVLKRDALKKISRFLEVYHRISKVL